MLPAVQIVAGRPEILVRWPIFALCGLSFVLSLPLFAPWSWWPLGYVVFVPWLIAACATRSALLTYLGTYLLGAAYFLFHFKWLYETTPEGYVAASLLYLALFFPSATWLLRQAYYRQLPLTIAFPVIWVAVEIVRAYNPLGFPWFFLGHSQIRLLSMVQIADVAGVYGVTFVVALVNGLIADVMLVWFAARWGGLVRWRPVLLTALPVALVLAATFAYGWYRLRQSQFTDGPMTAVLQGDFPMSTIPNDPNEATNSEKQARYMNMVDQAIAEYPNLDLLVLPETPWNMYLNREMRMEFPGLVAQHKKLARLTSQSGKSLLIGSLSQEPQPEGTYPAEYHYNSAFLYVPGEPEPQRYDKIHLVPFGEYVPFRYSRYLHWLYRFMAFGPFNPWGRTGYEYSCTAGKEFTVMKLPQAVSGSVTRPSAASQSSTSGDGRFAVTICFEDAIPHVFRRFVVSPDGTKRVDFMLNISNDGWFGHSAQQPQHLVNCAFRAIENRMGVARAVNTGVSGFIDPDGRWHDLVVAPGEPPHAGGSGYRVARIKLDLRVSFYSVNGDVFGLVCLVLTLLVFGDGIVGYVNRRRTRAALAAVQKNGLPKMGKDKQL